MKVELTPGKYILAVSGGVDSMALLDLLAKKPDLELVVAHFDHGIRPESGQDAQFVEEATKSYGLPFEIAHATLGPKASEAAAREARYAFLEEIRVKHGAKAIITAHHQDDMVETAVINILRGTGSRGLVSIQSNPKVKRPLLGVKKAQILNYAGESHLKWREDATNQQEKYLRNYIRRRVVPKLGVEGRRQLIKNIDKVAEINAISSDIIATLSHQLLKDDKIERQTYASLPTAVSRELLTEWLRQRDLRNFDRRLIERVDTAIRTSADGRLVNIARSLKLYMTPETATFESS